MESSFESAIYFLDAVEWNNYNLIIFEGWMLMTRCFINNNPNSVDVLIPGLNKFLFKFNRFLLFL